MTQNKSWKNWWIRPKNIIFLLLLEDEYAFRLLEWVSIANIIFESERLIEEWTVIGYSSWTNQIANIWALPLPDIFKQYCHFPNKSKIFACLLGWKLAVQRSPSFQYVSTPQFLKKLDKFKFCFLSQSCR